MFLYVRHILLLIENVWKQCTPADITDECLASNSAWQLGKYNFTVLTDVKPTNQSIVSVYSIYWNEILLI